jgi:hypothetical protein
MTSGWAVEGSADQARKSNSAITTHYQPFLPLSSMPTTCFCLPMWSVCELEMLWTYLVTDRQLIDVGTPTTLGTTQTPSPFTSSET